jgi:cellulase/cellobiase CelA1
VRARTTGILIASLFFIASCGGSSSQSTASSAVVPTTTGKVNPMYAKFCAASSNLNTAMSGPHGENPAAITDPNEMKIAWANITDLSIELQTLTPKTLKKDADTMINSIVAMNKIFKENKYELLAIAKKPTVRDALTEIASDPAITEASTRFNTFLTQNCGV